MGKTGDLHYKRTFQHVKGFTAGLREQTSPCGRRSEDLETRNGLREWGGWVGAEVSNIKMFGGTAR